MATTTAALAAAACWAVRTVPAPPQIRVLSGLWLCLGHMQKASNFRQFDDGSHKCTGFAHHSKKRFMSGWSKNNLAPPLDPDFFTKSLVENATVLTCKPQLWPRSQKNLHRLEHQREHLPEIQQTVCQSITTNWNNFNLIFLPFRHLPTQEPHKNKLWPWTRFLNCPQALAGTTLTLRNCSCSSNSALRNASRNALNEIFENVAKMVAVAA